MRVVKRSKYWKTQEMGRIKPHVYLVRSGGLYFWNYRGSPSKKLNSNARQFCIKLTREKKATYFI